MIFLRRGGACFGLVRTRFRIERPAPAGRFCFVGDLPAYLQQVRDKACQGCEMIVMVTHGRGAFGEFLFGSQTKAVLDGSKLPLLVLH